VSGSVARPPSVSPLGPLLAWLHPWSLLCFCCWRRAPWPSLAPRALFFYCKRAGETRHNDNTWCRQGKKGSFGAHAPAPEGGIRQHKKTRCTRKCKNRKESTHAHTRTHELTVYLLSRSSMRQWLKPQPGAGPLSLVCIHCLVGQMLGRSLTIGGYY
jgi:hypothetical protein